MLFKIAQIDIKYLGYFWNKICRQKLSKTASFGHTGHLGIQSDHLGIKMNYDHLCVTEWIGSASFLSLVEIFNMWSNFCSDSWICWITSVALYRSSPITSKGKAKYWSLTTTLSSSVAILKFKKKYFWAVFIDLKRERNLIWAHTSKQCDQMWRFFALWVTF